MEKAKARNPFCQTWGHHRLEEDRDPRHCSNITQGYRVLAWGSPHWGYLIGRPISSQTRGVGTSYSYLSTIALHKLQLKEHINFKIAHVWERKRKSTVLMSQIIFTGDFQSNCTYMISNWSSLAARHLTGLEALPASEVLQIIKMNIRTGLSLIISV